MNRKKFHLIICIIFLITSFQLFPDDLNDDWLHVKDSVIYDAHDNPVWLTGINWFGFNCSERVFHGLWCMSLDRALEDVVAQYGFNVIRVPISTMLIHEWKNGFFKPISIHAGRNPHLVDKTSLEIFDYTIQKCKELGIKIIIDVHHPDDNNSGHLYPLWYKGDITPQIFYETWAWIAERYANDDTVIGFDIENEPHGKPFKETIYAIWNDSVELNNWKYAVEETVRHIAAVNRKALILVEGIESCPKDYVSWHSKQEEDYYNNWWGGNLRPVKKFPINLKGTDINGTAYDMQNKLVYSPHDYGPIVYEQPWFQVPVDQITVDHMYEKCWGPNWYYLAKQNLSPLLIGEWGGKTHGGHSLLEKNIKYLEVMSQFISQKKLHHTFWCLNTNSGDTDGIIKDWNQSGDKRYEVDLYKYSFVKPVLWQDRDGKFVSLDHQRPLGNAKIGISLSQYYQDGNIKPLPPEAGPNIQITSLENGTKFPAGTELLIETVTYNPTDAVFNKVEFYAGESLLATDLNAPYAFNWQNTTEGSHRIKAVLHTNKGVFSSQELTVYIGRYINAKISQPLQNDIVYIGDVMAARVTVDTNITANATVNFYDQKGQLLFKDTEAPYAYQIDTHQTGKTKIIAQAEINDGGELFKDSDEVEFNIKTPQLKLLYKCENNSINSATIRARVFVVNDDQVDFSLDQITLRYYFTADTSPTYGYDFWEAQIGTDNVAGSFITEDKRLFFEISFKNNVTLKSGDPNGTKDILFNINAQNWQPLFNQSNDDSFDASFTEPAEYKKIDLFYNGYKVNH